jgi:hypothetical protein
MLSPPVLFLYPQYSIYPVIIQCQHGYNLPDIVLLPYIAAQSRAKTVQTETAAHLPFSPSSVQNSGLTKRRRQAILISIETVEKGGNHNDRISNVHVHDV